MAVFSSKWLEVGAARRASVLQQSKLPSLEEKIQERTRTEPEKHVKGAFEGFAGGNHSHPKTTLSPATEVSDDDKARSAGFLPLLPGEMYLRQISPYSESFIQLHEDGKWNAWLETFDTRGRLINDDYGNLIRTVRKSVGVKLLASNVSTFDMALTEASKYAN